MPRAGTVKPTNENLRLESLDMAYRRKQLEQAIDVAKQQVAASERERFVYEVLLMSLKKKRADLGRPKLVRSRSKPARQNSLEASK
jgi:putative hemolysin